MTELNLDPHGVNAVLTIQVDGQTYLAGAVVGPLVPKRDAVLKLWSNTIRIEDTIDHEVLLTDFKVVTRPDDDHSGR